MKPKTLVHKSTYFYQLRHKGSKGGYFQSVKVVIQKFSRFKVSEFTTLSHYSTCTWCCSLMSLVSFHTPCKHKKTYDVDLKLLSGVIERQPVAWHGLRITNPSNHKTVRIMNKSSHRRCSIKEAVLKNFAIFTGKRLRLSFILIKLQATRLATLLKRNSSKGIFLWIMQNFTEQLF